MGDLENTANLQEAWKMLSLENIFQWGEGKPHMSHSRYFIEKSGQLC